MYGCDSTYLYSYCLTCWLIQALKMVSHESNSMAHIFLITDGAVENERDICNVVQDSCGSKGKLPFLRISTFGIGKCLLFVILFCSFDKVY